MRYLWYHTMRNYVKLGLYFFFKEIRVQGLETIPKNTPLLLVSGHRNGMIDPILISTTNKMIYHYLTRASSFKNSFADRALRSLNLIPIYRIRDGVDSIKKNKEVFDTCASIFRNQEAIIIFPEGSDGLPRRIRTLKKGFARIVFHFIESNPSADVMIVPVGLNYNNVLASGSSVHIIFGKAFSSKDYYKPADLNKGIDDLKTKVGDELKKLVTHIEDETQYDRIVADLLSKGVDFLDPDKANRLIASNADEDIVVGGNEKKNQWELLVSANKILFLINTVFPLLIWKMLKPIINRKELISTFKFGYSLVVIPLFYLLQGVAIGYFFGRYSLLLYWVLSIVMLYVYKNNKQTDIFVRL